MVERMEALLFLLVGLLMTGIFAMLGGVWSRKKRFLDADQQAVVLKYFPFHASLPPQERERFERVTGRFLQDKEWQGAGIEIKEEMKVMISACADPFRPHHRFPRCLSWASEGPLPPR